MASSIDVRFDAYSTLGFGSISGTFAAVGSALTHNYRIIHLVNTMNADAIFSFDGTTNNLYIPAGSFALYDLQTNEQGGSNFVISLQTQIYVKSPGSPSSGAVYVMGVYGKGQ